MKKIAVALAVVTGAGLAWAGCSQSTPAVVVRSLERSKRAAFICVRNPYAVVPGQELDACFTPGETPGLYNYAVPHVISLVTQTARGEVAMIDVTAQSVVDVDRSVPGYNFLPVGALPTDIVSTPGGNASFVGIGDPVRPGIFALPTALLPLRSDSKPPTYGTWPACALPPGGAPTEILIVADNTKSASDPGGRRAHCDGSPALELDEGVTDLAPETQLFGRAKLAVLLPELSELDIIDAQDLLARPPGSFDPCPVEHRVFLTVNPDLPPITPPTPPVPEAGPRDAADDALDAGDGAVSTPDGEADDAGGSADSGGSGVDAAGDGQVCGQRSNRWPSGSDQPHPYALALADDGRMFITDDSASVIHVVDTLDPCTAEEKAPLLPSSLADPNRAVVTAAIAVSPLTSYGKQFVYATDVKNNGSLMAFDVSTTSTNRRPLERHDRPYNPYDPPDRIALAAPVVSLTFATHEISLAKPDPITGITPRGMPCDPTRADDPNRPPDDFVSAGAGPRRLRGTFAFLALANGDLSVVDIDDYDAQCRRPRETTDSALGCTDMPPVPPIGYFPSASQEVSCNVVEPHRVRSMNFFTNVEKAGRHAPAMLTFPVLYDKDGTALSTDQSRPGAADLPKLLGPKFVMEEHDPASWPLMATVLSSTASPENGLYATPLTNAQVNWVAFDLRAPRAHVSQIWNVTYEGRIPWFSLRRGRLQCAADKSAIECENGDDPSHLELYDSAVGFCSGGAQGADLAPPGASGDILEIIDDMPDAADPYWSTVGGICSRPQCEQVFGTLEAPRVLDGETPVGRDIVIEKSYQGKLSLRNTVAETGGRIRVPIACCFPYPVAYAIRAGRQWVVTGQASGFAHHIIPDPDPKYSDNPMEQACVRSCDPNFELRNGRLVARSKSEPVPTYDEMEHPTARPDGATLFRNAQMRFVVWDTEGTACATPPCSARVRDRFFSFQEVGGFVPMRFGLSSSSLVMPQSVRFVRGLQLLAIPDPVAQGLILFNLSRLVTTVSFY